MSRTHALVPQRHDDRHVGLEGFDLVFNFFGDRRLIAQIISIKKFEGLLDRVFVQIHVVFNLLRFQCQKGLIVPLFGRGQPLLARVPQLKIRFKFLFYIC